MPNLIKAERSLINWSPVLPIPTTASLAPYLQRQLLDLLLELDVVLVGDVERHLQLGDGDLHLLLDAEDLGLQAGLGVGQAAVQLLDLQRQRLPAGQRDGGWYSGTGWFREGLGSS